MVALAQHVQHLAREPALALARLIGIRVDADGDVFRDVARPRQLAQQQVRRVHLGLQATLEVQARRQAEIGMRGPREGVDAAVLAAYPPSRPVYYTT